MDNNYRNMNDTNNTNNTNNTNSTNNVNFTMSGNPYNPDESQKAAQTNNTSAESYSQSYNPYSQASAAAQPNAISHMQTSLILISRIIQAQIIMHMAAHQQVRQTIHIAG